MLYAAHTAAYIFYMTLNDLKKGESGKVAEIKLPQKTVERLKALGISGGAELFMVRAAPLGDPIVIRVFDSEIILRRSVAGGIFLRKE